MKNKVGVFWLLLEHLLHGTTRLRTPARWFSRRSTSTLPKYWRVF